MYCSHCGHKLPDDSLFCDECGKPTSRNRSRAEELSSAHTVKMRKSFSSGDSVKVDYPTSDVDAAVPARKRKSVIAIAASLGTLVVLATAFLMMATPKSDSIQESASESAAIQEDIIPSEETESVLTDDMSYSAPGIKHVVVDEGSGARFIDNELLVMLENDANLETIDEIAESQGGEVVGKLTNLKLYQVRLGSAYSYADLTSRARGLEQDSRITSAIPNYVFESENASVSSDDPFWDAEFGINNSLFGFWGKSYYETSWGQNAIKTRDAWEKVKEIRYQRTQKEVSVGNLASDMTIGVKENEIYTEHEDVNIKSVLSMKESSSNEQKNIDDRNHSAHVAGIIGATSDNKIGISGIAPGVNLVGAPVKAADRLGFEATEAELGEEGFGDKYEGIDDNFHVSSAYVDYLYLDYLVCKRNAEIINISMENSIASVFATDTVERTGTESEYAVSEFNRLSSLYAKLINRLVEQGHEFLIVQAAGNVFPESDDKAKSPAWPSEDDKKQAHYYSIFANIGRGPAYEEEKAANDRIIVVGNACQNGDSFTTYETSCIGERVDVMAPGTMIFSAVESVKAEKQGLALWPKTTDKTIIVYDDDDKHFVDETSSNDSHAKYAYMTGTSMAAPMVSGVAALIWEANPYLTGAQVKDILRDSNNQQYCGSFGDGGNGVRKECGMLDANKAVEVAINTQGELTNPIYNTTNSVPTAADQEEEPETPPVATHDVVTSDFEFDIPDYWKGKVEWSESTNEYGLPSVDVYPLDPSFGPMNGSPLVTVSSVPKNSPAAQNMGDHMKHVAHKADGSNNTVLVTSTNWYSYYAHFFFSNPNYAGSSQENEFIDFLLDLSVGGSTAYQHPRLTAANASNPGELFAQYEACDINYLKEALVPSLLVKC